MGRNPKDSPWYSTRRENRHRKGITLTLPPEALDALDAMSDLAGSRSALVESLVMAEARRRGITVSR